MPRKQFTLPDDAPVKYTRLSSKSKKRFGIEMRYTGRNPFGAMKSLHDWHVRGWYATAERRDKAIAILRHNRSGAFLHPPEFRTVDR